jgi:hypothetical protein
MDIENLTSEKAQDIKAIELNIKATFNYDEFNTYHIKSIMLNELKVFNHLNEMVLPNYVKRLYKSFIYPMYFYLEFTNNYLTVEKIANDYGLGLDTTQALILKGRGTINKLIILGY